MLTLYRRHTSACGRPDRYYKRCSCPMWVEGTLDRQYMRKSLHTQSWERARGIVDDWEASGAPKPKADVPTVQQAVTAYLAEDADRGIGAETMYNARAFFDNHFLPFCARANYQTIDEVDLACLREFLALYADNASTTKKLKRTRLTGLMKFCIAQKWITENPVKQLGKLIVTQTPTDYLNQADYASLLAAVPMLDDAWQGKTRAFVLLLRWSGLRFADALFCERHRLDSEGRLLLYQAKTGLPVFVPLPDHVTQALRQLPGATHFFWDKSIKRASFYNAYRRKFAELVAHSGIVKHVHPHMLRDTFAIELLLAGVPLDQVSILLGHQSIKTTEKHYAPWVKARQDQLMASVRLAWG